MRPLPNDPMALQGRLISNICADLMDGGNRFQAMREIRKQHREREGGNALPSDQ